MKHILSIIYIILLQSIGFAQFNSTYIANVFSVNGVESGKPVYQYRDTLFFKMNVGKLQLSKMTKGIVHSNDTGLLYKDSVDYIFEVKNKPIIPTNTNELINGAGFLTSEIDGSTSNEIQVLSASNDTIFLSKNGGSIKVPNTNIPLRDKSGLLSTAPIFFADTFSVNSATPTIDLSAYLSATGKYNWKLVSVDAYRVGATANNIPSIVITSLSTSSLSLLITQTNTATVSILGINVLNGLPSINVPDPQNIKVVFSFYLY